MYTQIVEYAPYFVHFALISFVPRLHARFDCFRGVKIDLHAGRHNWIESAAYVIQNTHNNTCTVCIYRGVHHFTYRTAHCFPLFEFRKRRERDLRWHTDHQLCERSFVIRICESFGFLHGISICAPDDCIIGIEYRTHKARLPFLPMMNTIMSAMTKR